MTLKNCARRLFWRMPRAFYGYHKLVNGKVLRQASPYKPKITDESTSIVVEGFPRSANTYVAYAIIMDSIRHDRDLRVAHHIHSPTQFQRGGPDTKYLVLIRHPLGVLISMTYRQDRPNLTDLLVMYVDFYLLVSRNLDRKKFIVVEFEEIVTGSAFSRIDNFVGTSLIADEINKEDVYGVIECRYIQRKSEIDEMMIARPSTKRADKNHAQVMSAVERSLETDIGRRAIDIYTRLAGTKNNHHADRNLDS